MPSKPFVTIVGSPFDSCEMVHIQRFSFTFDAAGTYTYFCDLHRGIIGTITVTWKKMAGIDLSYVPFCCSIISERLEF